MPSTRNKIPERWEEYSPIRSVVPGTRFIAFKTPLKAHIASRLEEEADRFTPDALLKKLYDMRLRLGLIIDLTNTDRYYEPEEFISQDVHYVKLKTEGKTIPAREVYLRFREIVRQFLDANWENDLLIGVHCTHGVNRTGYLISRYMVEELNYAADEAIRAFAEGRGHEIEREEYKKHIMVISEKISQGEYPVFIPEDRFEGNFRKRRFGIMSDDFDDGPMLFKRPCFEEPYGPDSGGFIDDMYDPLPPPMPFFPPRGPSRGPRFHRPPMRGPLPPHLRGRPPVPPPGMRPPRGGLRPMRPFGPRIRPVRGFRHHPPF